MAKLVDWRLENCNMDLSCRCSYENPRLEAELAGFVTPEGRTRTHSFRDICDELSETLRQGKPRYEIVRVIFNDPATIVFWKDGSKTIVKCEGETFDKEKGLAMALVKKFLGNKGNYYNVFKEYINE